MFFRYSSSIRRGKLNISPSFGNIKLFPDDSTVIVLCGSNNSRVKLEACRHNHYCEVICKLDISEYSESILESLNACSAAQYQKEDEIVAPYPGEWLKIIVVDPNDFPQSFGEFMASTRSLLRKRTEDFMRTFRWRMNLSDSQGEIAFSKLEWSKDKVFWSRVEYLFAQPEVHIHFQLDASGVPQEELGSLVMMSNTEPIYHELFRESWGLLYSNPRSSIVIGIAAAEVAMKECVGELIPDSRWLVEESPSPPLVAMIKNYLPLLPAKNRFNDEVLSPPKSIRRDIEEGVKLRNKVVHVGRQTPSDGRLKEILLSVKDFLWLIDYYRGYTWSLDYIRDETLVDMGVRKDNKKTSK